MPDSNDFQYDVALSFLSQDEPLARSLSAQLSESLSVFVYSERQKELAGTDGLETFRQTFLSRSRVVVVLYRQGWGQTKWTGVEQEAIKERAFDDGGWDFLLFVTLDQASPLPLWVPKTHIRLDYSKFGDQLLGAIKLRVQEAGGHLKVETALEKALRIRAIEQAKLERQSKLHNESSTTFPNEWNRLRERVAVLADEIAKSVPLEYAHRDEIFNLRTNAASISFVRSDPYPHGREFFVKAASYIGRLTLPGQQQGVFYLNGVPQKESEVVFHFDYNAGYGWCWRLDDRKERLLTTDTLADFLMQMLLQAHQDVESGKLQRRRPSRTRAASQWS
jgi:hypothetical protein